MNNNQNILIVILLIQLITVAACIYLLDVLMAISVVCLWIGAIGLGINIAKTYPKF